MSEDENSNVIDLRPCDTEPPCESVPGEGYKLQHVELPDAQESPHKAGVKLDKGKPEWLHRFLGYFPRAVLGVTTVSDMGAVKYTEKGWVSVPNGYRRYTEAMGRHLLAEMMGERYDKESHICHAAHTAWNAMARLELLLMKGEKLKNNE